MWEAPVWTALRGQSELGYFQLPLRAAEWTPPGPCNRNGRGARCTLHGPSTRGWADNHSSSCPLVDGLMMASVARPSEELAPASIIHSTFGNIKFDLLHL